MHRLIMTSNDVPAVVRRIARKPAEVDPGIGCCGASSRIGWKAKRSAMRSLIGVRSAESSSRRSRVCFPSCPRNAASARRLEAYRRSRRSHRRSVYIFVRRNTRYPMLRRSTCRTTHEICSRRDADHYRAASADDAERPGRSIGRRLSRARCWTRRGRSRRQAAEAFRLAYSRKPDGWEKDRQSLRFFATSEQC